MRKGKTPKEEITKRCETISHGLTYCSSDERICLQCRRLRFNPWIRKILWRREWQPTLVFLHGESHGQRSLAGYSSWGYKESDMTEPSLININVIRIPVFVYAESFITTFISKIFLLIFFRTRFVV